MMDATSTSRPLDWIVLKIAQRCNLNCSYCYVYNRGDDSWRSRPAIVGDDVIRAIAGRIVEHCASHQLSRFEVEFHGGEPLLVGKDRFESITDLLTQRCAGVRLHFR